MDEVLQLRGIAGRDTHAPGTDGADHARPLVLAAGGHDGVALACRTQAHVAMREAARGEPLVTALVHDDKIPFESPAGTRQIHPQEPVPCPTSRP